MKQEQQIVLSNNATIGVEMIDSSIESDVASRSAPVNFSGVIPSIVGICKDVEKAVSAVAPKRATVEFGLRLAVETSGLVAILTKGSMEANLKISLEWAPTSEEG